MLFASLLLGLQVLSLSLSSLTAAEAESVNKTSKTVNQILRGSRVLPLFELVRFTNNACVGSSSSTNGTCYTKDECTTKGGSSSGSCANGFGVCCIFTPGCGSTTTENTTYLAQSSSSTIPTPCTYKICTISNDICRIKLNFRTFNIAGPYEGLTVPLASATHASLDDAAIGDCITDTFTLTNPTGTAAPVICGINSGQHMIVDVTHPGCITAEFSLSSGSSSTREWDIVATQYTCADAHDIVGSQGSDCLQYHYGSSTGTISSFNFPTTTHSLTTTHLSRQDYTICIRQEKGKCGICYNAAIAAPFISSTFGISVSSLVGMAQSSTECTSDYITIPNGSAAPYTFGATTAATQFCGRFLAVVATNSGTANDEMTSVCSSTVPFNIRVFFDDNELITNNIATMATLNENQDMPGGILGFKLNYAQQDC